MSEVKREVWVVEQGDGQLIAAYVGKRAESLARLWQEDKAFRYVPEHTQSSGELQRSITALGRCGFRIWRDGDGWLLCEEELLRVAREYCDTELTILELKEPAKQTLPLAVAKLCGAESAQPAERAGETRERFYHWWSGLSKEERINCWYDLDAMAHGEVVSALRTKLASATARAEAAEAKVACWEQLAEATVAVGLPKAFFWKGAKSRFLVRFAGGEAAADGSFTSAVVELAAKLGLLSPPQKKPTDEGGRGETCPNCGAPEVPAQTPRTTYACGSSDYDQRPGTFAQKCASK